MSTAQTGLSWQGPQVERKQQTWVAKAAGTPIRFWRVKEFVGTQRLPGGGLSAPGPLYTIAESDTALLENVDEMVYATAELAQRACALASGLEGNEETTEGTEGTEEETGETSETGEETVVDEGRWPLTWSDPYENEAGFEERSALGPVRMVTPDSGEVMEYCFRVTRDGLQWTVGETDAVLLPEEAQPGPFASAEAAMAFCQQVADELMGEMRAEADPDELPGEASPAELPAAVEDGPLLYPMVVAHPERFRRLETVRSLQTCPLPDAEFRQLAAELGKVAHAYNEAAETEAEYKAQASAAKKRADGLGSELARLGEQLHRNEQFREVECEWVADQGQSRKLLFRLDTGALAETRPLSADDLFEAAALPEEAEPAEEETTEGTEEEKGEPGEETVDAAWEVICADRVPRISHLQRRLGLRYGEASMVMDELERRGIVGPSVPGAERAILRWFGDGAREVVGDGSGEALPGLDENADEESLASPASARKRKPKGEQAYTSTMPKAD